MHGYQYGLSLPSGMFESSDPYYRPPKVNWSLEIPIETEEAEMFFYKYNKEDIDNPETGWKF